MLHALRCNSDVQVTYRLPIMKETHSKLCKLEGCLSVDFTEVVRAQEQSQRDQIGYITDYISKRQPVSIKEIDRFVQGHRQLQQDLKHDKASLKTMAVRHTQRLLSDLYGRATTRKAVEVTNLLVCRKVHDVTAAESIKSHLLVPFPCSDYMRLQKVVCAGDMGESHYQGYEINNRHSDGSVYVPRGDQAELYGYRGAHTELASLSAYEFHELWETQRTHYSGCPPRGKPTGFVDGIKVHMSNDMIHSALLTESGLDKLRTGWKAADLQAGDDYVVRSDSGVMRGRDWLAYPKESPFRHSHIMVRRKSPAIPRFDGRVLAPSGSANQHAKHLSVYFRPWSMISGISNSPLLSEISFDEQSWLKSWNKHLTDGVNSYHIKQVIQNFLSTFHSRDTHGHIVGEQCVDTCKVEVSVKSLNKPLTTKRSGCVPDESFQFVTNNWGGVASMHKRELPSRSMPTDIKDALKNAKASQNPKSLAKGSKRSTTAAPAAATLTTSNVNVVQTVEEWKAQVTSSVSASSPAAVKCKNDEQRAVVRLIADRILAEHADCMDGAIGRSEPTRALITGGPGVGKSFVIKAARSLFQKLGYVNGTHYAFTSLQAVVASQLGGQTLHSLFGLNMYGNPSNNEAAVDTVASTLNSMRWLVIDEISQVTAELLRICELESKEKMSGVDTHYHDESGCVRPWGGLNVLFVGDFLQLPPPGKGACLSSVPDDIIVKLTAWKPNVTQGLKLIWEDVNEVIELTEQIR